MITIDPVRHTVTVKASLERAFCVFTEEFDSWWPRGHHIGKSPMKKAIIEGRAGGRCYTQQVLRTSVDSTGSWESYSSFSQLRSKIGRSVETYLLLGNLLMEDAE
jgi:hypothetical protein